MNRIYKLAAWTTFVSITCSNALGAGIINGAFEFQRTCPWQATASGMNHPVVRGTDGNPCSYLSMATGDDDLGAGVRQDDFLLRAQNGDWVILEFDARVSGSELSEAQVTFVVTGADVVAKAIPTTFVPPNPPVWQHFILATQVTDLDV